MFNELEEEYRLKTGSVLAEKVNVVLAHPPCSIRSAQSQSSSAQDLFWKRHMEDAVWIIGNVEASEAHMHILRSKLVFYHWNKTFYAAKEKVENVNDI